MRISVIAVTLVLMSTASCEQEPRRIPYIPPTLHNWPLASRASVRELHVFETGSLLRRSPLDLFHTPKKPLRDPVLAFVLIHPREGPVVVDTGLNHRIHQEGGGYLDGGWRVPYSPELKESAELPAQMRKAAIDPLKVRWVVATNLRFYRAGEIEAFPNARIVVARAERSAATEGAPGVFARELDEVLTWHLVDLSPERPVGTFPSSADLFGDGSIVLLDAAGPTAGNVAVLMRLKETPLLLAGDLAPKVATVRYASEPHWIHDGELWWDRIWRLKRFKDLDPSLVVLPGLEPNPPGLPALPIRWHRP